MRLRALETKSSTRAACRSRRRRRARAASPVALAAWCPPLPRGPAEGLSGSPRRAEAAYDYYYYYYDYYYYYYYYHYYHQYYYYYYYYYYYHHYTTTTTSSSVGRGCADCGRRAGGRVGWSISSFRLFHQSAKSTMWSSWVGRLSS